MTRAEWLAEALERHEGLAVMDGYDDCIVGLASQFSNVFFVYDRERVIAKLAKDMGREDAEEFHEFTQAGAWVGETTPAFIDFAPKR